MPLKIIPVIDVLHGLAVHAVRGERRRYKPLESVLCGSADPLEVAKAFKGHGFGEVYLADLDAIMDGRRSIGLYRRLGEEAGLRLMVDAGTPDAKSALEVAAAGVERVVMGTETLAGLDALSEAVEALGAERVVVSLDVKGGRLMSRSAEIDGLDPPRLARKLEDRGVNYVILLDLDRVGVECGVNLKLLEAFLGGAGLRILVGGGVRSVQELLLLRDLGVYGVLSATALHKGKISIEALRAEGLI
ncbi:MAG: HisA/HisF-related TIM barrel protein [Candidatus Bathyarchaeia archaeon]